MNERPAYDETDTELDFDPANWRDHAACAGTKADLFFPDKYGNGNEAKKICAGCSVRSECLDYATSNHVHFGIFGGLSARERRPLGGQPPRERRPSNTPLRLIVSPT